MRISDWSSDVCSSDLSAYCAGSLSFLQSAFRQIRTQPVYRPGFHRNGGPVRHCLARKNPWAALLRWISAADRRDVIGGVRQRRSEEHTSELQSLMRISYADFCLKNKPPQQTWN